MTSRNLLKRLADWAQRRTVVGGDAFGRVYLEQTENGRRGTTVKRVFEGDAEAPPPPEWNAWLRHTRAAPPSSAEQTALAAERLARAERVEVLRREEASRRLRAAFQDERGVRVGQQSFPGGEAGGCI